MHCQQYYTNQVGGGQSIYTGTRYQRGHGLGNLLGSLFRTVSPMLRKTAINLGKDVMNNLMKNKNKITIYDPQRYDLCLSYFVNTFIQPHPIVI